MPGIKLAHPTLKNCVYTLIHEGRPLTAPHFCGVCNMLHFHKTYHLGLDSHGQVVVSETVYARLQEAGLDDLRAIKEIKKPPPQKIDMAQPPEPKLVVSREGMTNG